MSAKKPAAPIGKRSIEGIRMWINSNLQTGGECGRTLEHANEEVRTLLAEIDRLNARIVRMQSEPAYRETVEAAAELRKQLTKLASDWRGADPRCVHMTAFDCSNELDAVLEGKFAYLESITAVRP